MKQVGAVVLQVDAFAGSLGGDEDAQRVAGRVGVERALHSFAGVLGHAAVEGGNHRVRLAAGRQRGTQLPLEEALGVGILREDQQAAVVGLHPVHEVLHARVGQAPGGFRYLGHAGENRALAAVGIGRFGLADRTRRCRGHGRIALLADGLLIHFRAVVVCVRGVDQEAECGLGNGGGGGRGCVGRACGRLRGQLLDLGLKGLPVDPQRRRERLDRRQ